MSLGAVKSLVSFGSFSVQEATEIRSNNPSSNIICTTDILCMLLNGTRKQTETLGSNSEVLCHAEPFLNRVSREHLWVVRAWSMKSESCVLWSSL